MKFEDKFIAFIDVLGFKDMVSASESGNGIPLSELMENLSKLGTQKDEERYEKYGPRTCPQSKYIERNLNFKVTQISDCVIVSSELSPAGIINLISHCWGAVIELLMKGIMCRGYITKGSIYHKNNQMIGTGYQEAFSNESGVTAFKREANERGTPFVEIDPKVCNYIEKYTDECVKKMFLRMIKSEDGTTALFPFKCLSHSFIIGGFGSQFNSEREKESNNNYRVLINSLITRISDSVDPTNMKAVNKVNHYIRVLEKQLAVCDQIDEVIDKLCSPVLSR